MAGLPVAATLTASWRDTVILSPSPHRLRSLMVRAVKSQSKVADTGSARLSVRVASASASSAPWTTSRQAAIRSGVGLEPRVTARWVSPALNRVCMAVTEWVVPSPAKAAGLRPPSPDWGIKTECGARVGVVRHRQGFPARRACGRCPRLPPRRSRRCPGTRSCSGRR